MTRVIRQSSRDKQLADEEKLVRAWKKWHSDELAAARERHPDLIAELMNELGKLQPNSARDLIAFIRRTDWATVDYPARLTVLHQIHDAITKLRERHGLEPFDDGVPGERDNVFRVVKEILVPALSTVRN
jgi:hypothetical protein